MPKREEKPKIDILGKFDAIEVKPSLNIPPDDLEFCSRLQVFYEDAILSFKKSEEGLNRMSEEQPNPDFLDISERWNGEKYISKSWEKAKEIAQKDPFGMFRFHTAYGLLYLDGLRKKVEDRLYKDIVEYFNTKYNLRLSSTEEFWRNPQQLNEYKRKPGYVEVVNWVLDECGGIDFANIGFENLKQEFRTKVGRKEDIEVTSKKITLSRFIYFEKSYRGEYTWGYRSGIETLEKLRRFITFYETGELGDQIFDMKFNSSDEPMFTKPYELESTSKVKSIKVFKNGKLELRFNEVGQEKEFFDLFEFYKL